MEPATTFRKSFEQLLNPEPEVLYHEELQVEVTYEGDTSCEGKRRMKPSRSEVKIQAASPLVSSPNHNPVQHLQEGGGDDTHQETPGSVQTEKQVKKNTVVLGLSFALVFSAFTALQSLQSSLFLETGLGLHSLSVLYGLAVFSCLYGPVLVQKLSPNWTIMLSFALVALFVSSFFYPRPYTLVPSAALLGLSFGPLFCAQVTLLTQLVSRMAYLTAGIRDKVQQRYLRLFYIFFNSSRIWGHLVAALVVHYAGEVAIFTSGSSYMYPSSSTTPGTPPGLPAPPYMHRTSPQPSLCADFQCGHSLPSTDSSRSKWGVPVPSFVIVISSEVTLILASVFLGFILLGMIVVIVFLEKFDVYVYQDPMERSIFTQTLRQVRLVLVDPHMRLVLPMLIFTGLQQGFLFADFTKSYVSCALGLEAVGYTMMSMGSMNTIGALTVHQFIKHIKRPTIMAAGLICQAGLLMVLWLWTPVKDDVAVFYVIAAGWGLCNAIWETLTMSYVAMTYADEWQVPFSAYHLMQMIGMAIACIYSTYLCTEIKIYILAAALVVSIVPYTLVEFRVHHRTCVQERTAVL